MSQYLWSMLSYLLFYLFNHDKIQKQKTLVYPLRVTQTGLGASQWSLSICHVKICVISPHTATKWMYLQLTLSSCENQEKHKENQAQSLHVWVPLSSQTLLLRGWCCIYTAFQAWGRGPSCSVQITITEYRWMMGVWGLKVRTISLLSLVNSCCLLRIRNYF